MFEFVVMTLATWRICMLLVYEDISKPMRDSLGVGLTKEDSDKPLNVWGWVFGCFWCCSLVVALQLNLLAPCAWPMMIMRPFAVSGAAILIHYIARIHLVLGE